MFHLSSGPPKSPHTNCKSHVCPHKREKQKTLLNGITFAEGKKKKQSHMKGALSPRKSTEKNSQRTYSRWLSW